MTHIVSRRGFLGTAGMSLAATSAMAHEGLGRTMASGTMGSDHIVEANADDSTPVRPTGTDILVVVDVQNDFLPGGSLAVPNGDAVITPINALAQHFAHVILTQDWHPAGHISFASSHAGKQPFETITLEDGQTQVLWPDHCLQGSHGSAIADGIHIPKAELMIRKGYRPNLDSYSAFVEADRRTRTGLSGYLKERGFRRVFVAGLATDFCVGWTAIDAQQAGFETFLVEDAARGIDTHGSLAAAMTDMAKAGVKRTTTAAFAS